MQLNLYLRIMKSIKNKNFKENVDSQIEKYKKKRTNSRMKKKIMTKNF